MTIKASKERSNATPPPVAPYPEFLPLDDPNLPWDRFEAFCEQLISRLHSVKRAYRYGRRGSPQKGIDIVADLDNGEGWAFQCRQWQKFTKTDATKAIQQTTYKIYDFTPEQQKNLSAIVWLYRGQTDRFVALVAEY